MFDEYVRTVQHIVLIYSGQQSSSLEPMLHLNPLSLAKIHHTVELLKKYVRYLYTVERLPLRQPLL